MSERGQSPYDSIARRWLALVERRQENFLDLCNTGRWRHYYTKLQFLEEMRKVLRLRDQWAVLAGEPELGDEGPLLQNIQTPHRLLPERLVPLGPAPGELSQHEADMSPEDMSPEDMPFEITPFEDMPLEQAYMPPGRRRVGGLPAPHWPD